MLRYFATQPAAAEVPSRMCNPFEGPPHPLAQKAAGELMSELAQGHPFAETTFAGKHGGKMFGVLLVKDAEGRLGYLRGFSGTVAGQWLVPGFVPPLFDTAARDAVWPAAVAELARMTTQLKLVHEASQASALRCRAAHNRDKRQLADAYAEIERRYQELKQQRTARSCAVFAALLGQYVLPNGFGGSGGLPELFLPKPPPGGAGDCAAPKLLAYAYKAQLRPLALAEFWWGASAKGGSRSSGSYYAACTNKCGPVLGYMMQGLSTDFSGDPQDA